MADADPYDDIGDIEPVDDRDEWEAEFEEYLEAMAQMEANEEDPAELDFEGDAYERDE